MRRASPVLALLLLWPSIALLSSPAGAASTLHGVGVVLGDKDDKGGGGDDDDGDDESDNSWQDGKLVLLSASMPSFLPGQRGWVGLNWTATTDVCDIAVTATSPGASISYPTNTASYTSLYVNDALAKTNRDYTALDVSVPATTTRATTVTLRATYTKIPPGQVAKSDDLKVKDVKCTGGKKVTETYTVGLPIGTPSGPKAVLETPRATVPSGQATWVPLTFSTQYAGLDNFRVRLVPPAGLDVVYPGDGTSSGLARQAGLAVGAPDAASVRLQATSLAAGTYRIPVKATWNSGSLDTELTLTVQ